MLVVIGTDCMGSCKSNYHTIRTTVAPNTIGCVYTLFFSWSKRNLSILSKVLIIKALVIPIFTFIVSSCVIPEKYKLEAQVSLYRSPDINKSSS